MEFSVLFWNLWLENQLDSNKSDKLLNTLQVLVDKYNPDFIGLNEALKKHGASSPFVADLLKSLGYKYMHFTSFGPFSMKWEIGNAVFCKYPFKSAAEFTLGRNITAERKGFRGHGNKALITDISFKNKKKLRLITVHPIYLDTHNFFEHYRQMRSLAGFLKRRENTSDTIVGGDFNEPFHLPWSMKKNFYQQTGNFINRTWRNNASKRAFIRFNLDRIMWAKKSSLSLERFEVIKNDTSDHRPLYGRFSI